MNPKFDIRSVRGPLSLLAIVLAAGIFAPASASAYIYWVNNGSGSIGRANTDGSASDPTFIPGLARRKASRLRNPTSTGPTGMPTPSAAPISMARTGSRLHPSRISRAPTIHGGRIYWIHGGTTIGSANLDGSDPETTS